ncbi:PfkB family carbohydrate kinase [Paractinoplanes hotanensis]|uniref:PfkB family carbohydrate kinase n=1 Tax=Paractinoplanes hotanensis TaxID=2906497 RepID=A0ABT0YB16_9ACTN|nr:PfkB family carbohydrate kinase [Actinoplanes hotanensis]MCM4083234.1 PfkB family carbohydrate kinase [Actinoplanes hotanensis]
MTPTAAVVGQLARDLVLTVDQLPEPGSSGVAGSRHEQLGGKGANQAVALAQLGVRPSLIAVAGDDMIGDVLLAQARRDGIDVRSVIRRPGALTGLIVEILEPGGRYRYVEHLPPPVLLGEDDVLRARQVIEGTDAVLVQLQQPEAATLAAARIGHEAGKLVVLDGEIKDKSLLVYADVVRADEAEAAGLDEDVLDHGPKLLALARKDGNLFVWRGGRVTIPLDDAEVVDTTGGGDAFVAALTAALLAGASYEEAAQRATAASAATVTHVSGRPELRDV